MPSARHAIRLVAALKVQPESRILEIGTGSGYVTALLARLGLHVTTLERYKSLVAAASDRLKATALTNTTFVQEDGRNGYAEMGPFDRIVVHGSFETVPRSLLDQLASHGILMAAIGPAEGEQRITRFQKFGSRFEEDVVFPARLQPLESGVASFL
jgi:protein-L-isoaspartate(D-aspartate) O-methyltransferase